MTDFLGSLVTFAMVAGVRIATPGAGAAVVLNTASTRGRRVAYAAVGGCCLGILTWGLAVAIGVGQLLRQEPRLFSLLRLVGGLYLLFLGILSARRAWQLWTLRRTIASSRHGTPDGDRPFMRGLTASVTNPGLGAFYIVVAPTFVPTHVGFALALVVFAAIDASECALWFGALLAVGGRLFEQLRRPTRAACFELASAVYFTYLGMRLLVLLITP